MRLVTLFLSFFMVVVVSATGGHHGPPPPQPSSSPCKYSCPPTTEDDGYLIDKESLPFFNRLICTYKIPGQRVPILGNKQICSYSTKSGQFLGDLGKGKCPDELDKQCGPRKRDLPSDGLVQARSADVGKSRLTSRGERFQRRVSNPNQA